MTKIIPSRTARIMLISMIIVLVAMRLFLHSFSGTNLDIGPYNVHHLFIGVILLIASGLPLILQLPRGRLRWTLAALFGTGLALVVDECVYLIVTDGSDESYLLPESWIGAGVLVALVTIYIAILSSRKP